MKHKFLKSVVATFALVATLAVLPMASSVEAAEGNGTECAHETLILISEKTTDYSFYNYSIHIRSYEETYVCDDCGLEMVEHRTEFEDHFDPDGDGMCECGTFYY